MCRLALGRTAVNCSSIILLTLVRANFPSSKEQAEHRRSGSETQTAVRRPLAYEVVHDLVDSYLNHSCLIVSIVFEIRNNFNLSYFDG